MTAKTPLGYHEPDDAAGKPAVNATDTPVLVTHVRRCLSKFATRAYVIRVSGGACPSSSLTALQRPRDRVLPNRLEFRINRNYELSVEWPEGNFDDAVFDVFGKIVL